MSPVVLLILLVIFAFFARTSPGIRQIFAVLWILGSPCVAFVSLFGVAMDPNGAVYGLLFLVYAIGTIVAIMWLIQWRRRARFPQ